MICRSPNGLRDSKSIYEWKFDRIREVVLELLPEDEEPVSYMLLRKEAEQQFGGRESKAIGKVLWHVDTVVLEMEVRGELERVGETKPPMPLPRLIRRAPGVTP